MHEKLLEARVVNTVGGFAGRIDFWDVVNEMTHDPTWEKKNLKGPPAPAEAADYAEKALRWAHLANPKATLMLNEYDIVADAANFRNSEVIPRLRFLNLVDELQRHQAPRFEVGFQAHEPREEWFAPRNVLDACDAFGKRGYRVHMTELIPQSSGKPIAGGWRTGAWTADAQAEFADQFIRLAFGHPAVASVNFWGLSDRNIWPPQGGLVDEKYEPKPIYRAIRRLVREEWRTRNLSVRAAFNGHARPGILWEVPGADQRAGRPRADLRPAADERWAPELGIPARGMRRVSLHRLLPFCPGPNSSDAVQIYVAP